MPFSGCLMEPVKAKYKGQEVEVVSGSGNLSLIRDVAGNEYSVRTEKLKLSKNTPPPCTGPAYDAFYEAIALDGYILSISTSRQTMDKVWEDYCCAVQEDLDPEDQPYFYVSREDSTWTGFSFQLMFSAKVKELVPPGHSAWPRLDRHTTDAWRMEVTSKPMFLEMVARGGRLGINRPKEGN